MNLLFEVVFFKPLLFLLSGALLAEYEYFGGNHDVYIPSLAYIICLLSVDDFGALDPLYNKFDAIIVVIRKGDST
jgi:hypothetical protein